MFSYPLVLSYVLGAQKNRLIETVLLSTHNICFGWEIRKILFRYTLLTKGLAWLKTQSGNTTINAYKVPFFLTDHTHHYTGTL